MKKNYENFERKTEVCNNYKSYNFKFQTTNLSYCNTFFKDMYKQIKEIALTHKKIHKDYKKYMSHLNRYFGFFLIFINN